MEVDLPFLAHWAVYMASQADYWLNLVQAKSLEVGHVGAGVSEFLFFVRLKRLPVGILENAEAITVFSLVSQRIITALSSIFI